MALISLIILIVSLAVLSKSASIAVDNASKIANYFRISSLAVGFLLISLSTTLPELSVSVISSISGDGALAAGNAFGSVIANILLVLGLGAFFYSFKISNENSKDIALVLLITALVSLYVMFITSVRKDALGVFEGAVLLVSYLIYIFYIFKSKKTDGTEKVYVEKKEVSPAFLYFLISIIIVLVSSGFVVSSAIEITEIFNLTEGFVGATIIAIGTSLPEASICLQAIRKKRYGLALGNAIGASVANLTLVLGIAAIINPISLIMPIFVATLLFAILACILLLYIAAVNKKLGRIGGLGFIAIYIIYIASIFYLQFLR